MRTLSLLLLVLTFSLQPEAQAADETGVREAMTAFLRAFQDLDWQAFRRCWTDHPVMFVPPPGPQALTEPSPVTSLQRIDDPATFEEYWKTTFANIQKTAAGRGVTAPPYHHIEPQDMRVDVIATTAAVVTFHLSSPPRADGIFFLQRRMFTFARTSEGWKISHFHGSAYPVRR